jgi:short-subunit dehydrogenase
MVARNEGRILQLGSEVSKIPTPLLAVYAATKAFVLSFTEALRNELSDTDVTMTLLMPGATDTDFFSKADAEDSKVYSEMKLEDPGSVAEDAIEGLLAGDRRVVGKNAKMNVTKATLMPDSKNAADIRKQMEPSEKPHSETRQEPEHAPSKRQ